MPQALTVDDQFAALNMLGFISDMFTAAGKEQFTRDEILMILNRIRSDEELFDPDVVVAQQIATADVSDEEIPGE